MRINIVIDDDLMNQAKIRALRGKLNWEGDLDQMRADQ